MIKEKIDEFIKKIPAVPKNVKDCAKHLESGDLTKAANSAALDPAFTHYLINMVNKPIFGFRNYVKDIHQIFGILGVERASQVVNAYYASLILPKKWEVFKIDNADFQLLQSNLIYNWNKILTSLNYNKLHIASIVSLLPASLVVCEEIFEDSIEDVKIIKSYQDISYDELLYKMSGLKLFDIFSIICEKWELNEESIKFVKYLSQKIEDDTMLSKLAKYLHLLIFYELSKPKFVQAGLNDFIEFDVEFVQDIYPDFMNIVEVE